jgi:hypothetical protein
MSRCLFYSFIHWSTVCYSRLYFVMLLAPRFSFSRITLFSVIDQMLGIIYGISLHEYHSQIENPVCLIVLCSWTCCGLNLIWVGFLQIRLFESSGLILFGLVLFIVLFLIYFNRCTLCHSISFSFWYGFSFDFHLCDCFLCTYFGFDVDFIIVQDNISSAICYYYWVSNNAWKSHQRTLLFVKSNSMI